MTKIGKYILTLLTVLSVSVGSYAQTVYSCDFENAAENARWHLNQMANNAKNMSWPDKWYIGTALNCGATGTHALYISDDAGVSNSYSAGETTTIVSFRDSIAVRPNTTYHIMFDYRANGKSSGTDKLYVAWVPLPTPTAIRSFNSTRSVVAPAYAQAPYLIASLNDAINWTPFSGTFTTGTETEGKLVFLWSSQQNNPVNPPAIVDNIEIFSGTCPAPTGLNYSATGATLSWRGSCSTYDVRYLNTSTNTWVEMNGLTTTSVSLSQITEGYYIMYVRGNCQDGSHSEWVSISQFAYIKGIRCIDFMDLDAANCYTAKAASTTDANMVQTSKVLGKVDFGYDDPRSRHTLHYVTGETDPNTLGQLKTVPDGEVVSVRIGSHYNAAGTSATSPSAKAQSVEYTYKVPTGATQILKIQYAIVCNASTSGSSGWSHTAADQAKFMVDILDDKGNSLTTDGCTSANLSAGYGALGNYHTNVDPLYSSCTIIWYDWQTISLSLRNYRGRTIKIRLISSDCPQSMHFGYAYFTIGCESGELEGVSCGDFSTDHFTAPSGFDYRWYLEKDQSRVLSTEQTYNITSQDTNIYVVDVISKTGANCYYSLTANPNPRYPESEFYTTPTTRDCQNVVNFDNRSHISFVNRKNGVTTASKEAVEEVKWDFGDGSDPVTMTDSLFSHTYPQQGGQYQVKCISSMSSGTCQDTLVKTITLPALGDKRAANSYERCQGDKYTFMGTDYYDDFVDSVVVTSLATGCDSTSVVSVHFIDKSEYAYKDTICSDYGTYNFHGQDLLKTGTYTATLQNYLGCDSVVTLNLQVYPALEIRVDSAFARCADDNDPLTIPYLVNEGKADSVFIYMDAEALAAGFEPVYKFSIDEPVLITWDKTIRPNIYQGVVVFTSQWCTTRSYPIRIELDYPSSTLDQKNGIVAVLNDGYNGGYPLSSYQWYRNGEKIEGATGSYLNVSDEDMNAEYYAIVYRSDDNVVLPTCPIVYTGGGWRSGIDTEDAQSRLSHSLADQGGVVLVQSSLEFTVLDMLGRTVASYPAGSMSLVAPSVPGLYLVRFADSATARFVVK